jgi:hypothetical protein
MFNLRRWWLLCGAVLVGVVAPVVVSASADDGVRSAPVAPSATIAATSFSGRSLERVSVLAGAVKMNPSSVCCELPVSELLHALGATSEAMMT